LGVPAATATRTYLSPDARGITVGDTIWFDGPPGVDTYVIVTAVDPLFAYIDHTTNAPTAAAGKPALRSFIGNVKIIQDNIIFTALYGRDYTETISLAGNTSGFVFTTSMESNLGMPRTLSPNDKVYCKVYGKKNNVFKNAILFGGDDSETKNLTHPTVILWNIMKDYIPISEADMNGPAFQDVYNANTTEAVGFSIPDTNSDSFPTFKDLIIKLLKTQLSKLFLDNEGKWYLGLVEPVISSNKSTDSSEILNGSVSYEFNYDDISSDIVIEYAKREQIDEAKSGGGTTKFTVVSNNAKFLHDVNKQFNYESLHFREFDAEILANRIKFIMGERSGVINFNGKNKFFDSLIGDVIEIMRTKLPGFAFSIDELRTRDFVINQISKSLKSVNIRLDDQKGIEDNSSSW
jgi:hypothetical protein